MPETVIDTGSGEGHCRAGGAVELAAGTAEAELAGLGPELDEGVCPLEPCTDAEPVEEPGAGIVELVGDTAGLAGLVVVPVPACVAEGGCDGDANKTTLGVDVTASRDADVACEAVLVTEPVAVAATLEVLVPAGLPEEDSVVAPEGLCESVGVLLSDAVSDAVNVGELDGEAPRERVAVGEPDDVAATEAVPESEGEGTELPEQVDEAVPA